MIPVKLQLHNFLSYKEPQLIDFSNFNLAVLSGNNGVGKSSILEAITWATWGKTRAASDDNLIFQGQTSCWVEFIFEHDKNLYRIFRKRMTKTKTGQTFLEFQTKKNAKNLLSDDDWESIAEATIKGTNEKITRILKIPYEIFVNSSYLRQGHADEFTIKTPAERKVILAEVLGLNYYEALSIKAREQAREFAERIKLLLFQTENLQMQVSNKNEVKKNFLKIKQDSEALNKKLKILKLKLKNLDEKQKNYELIKERINNLKNVYIDLQTRLKEQEEDKKVLEQNKIIFSQQLKNKNQITNDYKNILNLEKENENENEKFRQYSRLREEVKVLEHIRSELENNAKRLNQISKCPMCLRPMQKTEAKKITEHLKEEYKQKYHRKFTNIKNSLEKLDYNLGHHQEIQNKIKILLPAKETKQALDLAENNLNNTNQSLEKIDLIKKKILTQTKKVAKEGIELKEKLVQLQKSQQEWEICAAEEEKNNSQLIEIESQLGQLKQELAQIEKQEQELKNLEKDSKLFQAEKQVYDELSLAFGKKGIQAMIIETSVATIEEEANLLLKKITDGRMQLTFITQKEKKSSDEELIETLEIRIRDELGIRDYEMYSGGEAFRINFAIRIALSKLLASRSGTQLKFLAIDEGFGMLDTTGREDLVAAINSISPDFEKIVVITHLQELKDLFPTKIEVTKDSQGSHLEVINT